MKKTIIIREQEDGSLAVDVLRDGYNIIEHTVYDANDEAAALIARIESEEDE